MSGLAADYPDELITGSVRRALVAQGADVPRITPQRVPAIPRTAAGKAPLIKAMAAH